LKKKFIISVEKSLYIFLYPLYTINWQKGVNIKIRFEDFKDNIMDFYENLQRINELI